MGMDLTGIPRSTHEPRPVIARINRDKETGQRLETLERGAPLRSSSLSVNGVKRLGIGAFEADADKFGIEVFDNNGVLQARLGEDGIEIFDSNGAVQGRLGELAGAPGTYGLEVLVGGVFVPVASLAEGGSRQTTAGTYEQTTPAGQNVGWLNVGPSIPIKTYTGKIEVTAGGSLVISGNKCTVAFSYSIVNATTGAVVSNPDQYRGVRCVHNGFGMNNSQSGELTITHNLPPGNYTINGQFQILASAGMDTTASITNRTLGVRSY